ncbi:hypothetical protein ASPZODRAFT_927639 [Penicilliopsis zonata CBS 506.65]|uniref:Glycosyl transferase family 8 C-terminal domain-containing protein n=1 Tax=Penicilliopsis zonata CBS 506.65 TaxID=1073090 RepID=A0A1L9S896_9EURO|nr:hypothetical protein ASPZODRAFT_927639 [Penicilliopsis zonata CBS 506.65]OJJ43388.1 hypothetical protein ASPZODRAFT_927639 [Penicilliopsis zonata CBS 506.65]
MDDPKTRRVWATVITNLDYLPGLLTLAYSLQRVQSAYPLVALYTDAFPQAEGLPLLQARGIPYQRVEAVVPASSRRYEEDPRFNDTWTKLVAFTLWDEYDRVVLLDSDMLVRHNMDEIMDLPLDAPGTLHHRIFAASHACACNPMKKPHYPSHWIPSNCALTAQHPHPDKAQKEAPPSSAGVGMLNSGLLVINPGKPAWAMIEEALADADRIEAYNFPDQELLSDVFRARWVALPYVYNALKTLRLENAHAAIWKDECVKNVHYIFAHKPWHETREQRADLSEARKLNSWWWEVTDERKRQEMERGVVDDY